MQRFKRRVACQGLLGLALTAMLAACSPPGAQKAQDAVRALIKTDPASAKFDGVTACIAPNGYFGTVTRKDAMGQDDSGGFVYLDGQAAIVGDSRFPALMNKCTGSEAAAAHEYIESRQAVGRVLLIP